VGPHLSSPGECSYFILIPDIHSPLDGGRQQGRKTLYREGRKGCAEDAKTPNPSGRPRILGAIVGFIPQIVIPGLVPGIQVDGRDKPGHEKVPEG